MLSLGLEVGGALQSPSSPRRSVKLSVELGHLPEVAGWFLLNSKGGLICGDEEGDGGQEGIGGAPRGSAELEDQDDTPRAPAQSFFVGLGHNYFIVASRTMDFILNEFTVDCSSPSFHRDRGCHVCALESPGLPQWS